MPDCSWLWNDWKVRKLSLQILTLFGRLLTVRAKRQYLQLMSLTCCALRRGPCDRALIETRKCWREQKGGTQNPGTFLWRRWYPTICEQGGTGNILSSVLGVKWVNTAFVNMLFVWRVIKILWEGQRREFTGTIHPWLNVLEDLKDLDLCFILLLYFIRIRKVGHYYLVTDIFWLSSKLPWVSCLQEDCCVSKHNLPSVFYLNSVWSLSLFTP